MSTSPRFMLKADARSEASGPYSASELRDLVRVGMLTSASLVSQEGTNRWVPAIKVKGLLPAASATGAGAAPPAAAQAAPTRVPAASRAAAQPPSAKAAASGSAQVPPPPHPTAPAVAPKAGGFLGRFARLPVLGSLAIAQTAPAFVGACVLTIVAGFCLGLLVGFLPPRLL